MPEQDQAAAPLVEAPRSRFLHPPARPTPDPPAAASPEPTPAAPSPEPEASRPAPNGAKASSATSASRTDRAARAESAEALAAALVGVLTIAYGLAWWASRRPDGRGLRRPTKAHYQAVAEPLGRIGARHLPIDLAPAVVKSLLDAAAAGAGVTDYLQAGPLLEVPEAPKAPEGGPA